MEMPNARVVAARRWLPSVTSLVTLLALVLAPICSPLCAARACSLGSSVAKESSAKEAPCHFDQAAQREGLSVHGQQNCRALELQLTGPVYPRTDVFSATSRARVSATATQASFPALLSALRQTRCASSPGSPPPGDPATSASLVVLRI